MALVCFAGCRLKFIITGKQLALKIVNNPYTHQGFLHKVLVVFYMLKTRATSPFGKYIPSIVNSIT